MNHASITDFHMQVSCSISEFLHALHALEEFLLASKFQTIRKFESTNGNAKIGIVSRLAGRIQCVCVSVLMYSNQQYKYFPN
jgi:hypothetical protein